MTRTFSFLGWICLGFLLITTIQAIHLPNNNARHHNLGHFHKLAGSILKEEQLKGAQNSDGSLFSLSASVGSEKYRNIEELNEFAEQPKLLERGLNLREITSNPLLTLQKKAGHEHKKGFLPVFLAMKQDDDEEGGDEEIVDDDEEIVDDDAALEDNGDDTAEDAGDVEVESEHTEEVVENGDTAQVVTTDTTVTTEEVPLSEDAAGETVIASDDVAATETAAEPVVETTTTATQVSAAPAETQSSDLGNRIDEMATTLHSTVNTMKSELTRTGTQIQENLQTEVQGSMNQLTNNVQNTLANLTDLIRAEGKETRQEIAHNTYQLQQQINGVAAKTDQNSGETISLEIMLLSGKLEEKQEELEKLDAEIAKLQADLPTEGINTCSLYTDCATCAADASCGWCTTEKKCVRGDETGPLFDTCNFYNYQQCGGDACSRYRDCYSCILDPFCGWCGNENANNGGSCLEQPENYNGCPGAVNWFHSQGASNQCPLPQSPATDEDSAETAELAILSQQGSTENVNTEEGRERQAQEELLDLLTQRESLSAEINNLEGQIEGLEARQAELLGTSTTTTTTATRATVTETANGAVAAESVTTETDRSEGLTIINEQNTAGEESTTVIEEETGEPIYEETVVHNAVPPGEEELPSEEVPEGSGSEEEIGAPEEGSGPEPEVESEAEPSGDEIEEESEAAAEAESSGEEEPSAEEPTEETAEDETLAEEPAEEPTEEPTEEPADEDLDEELDEDLDEEPEEPEEEPEDDYEDEDEDLEE